MIGNLLGPELVELIEKREFNQLRTILAEFNPLDLAELLGDLNAADQAVLLRILPQDLSAEVFEHLDLDRQELLVKSLGNEDVARILNEMSADDRTALLEELPTAVTQKLLNLLSPEERKTAVELLGYPEESIGRRMRPEYVAIQQNWTVEQVLQHLRRQPEKRDSINQLYVIDDKGRLVDSVRLRNVAVAAPATPMVELLENRRFALRASDDQELAVVAFKRYDVTMLPVVDSHDALVGVVTVDDVLDVEEQEATEDIQKLGGMEALDAPYLKIGMLSMIKKRAGWLALLFMGEMLTASAMGIFEDEIERAVVLALFLPLIISSGGNSGSQATSLIIRSMAVRDVTLAQWWHVLRRELVAGLALGGVLAGLGFVRILVWQLFGFKDYGSHFFLIAATISLSLVGVVLFGSLAGAMLPFILRSVRLDPAVASAPLVATLVDVSGLVIFFCIAQIVLSTTLLAPPDPKFTHLEQMKTTRALQQSLNLGDEWEISEAVLDRAQNKLIVDIGPSDKFWEAAERLAGGKIDHRGQGETIHSPLMRFFGHDAELHFAPPRGAQKNSGAPYLYQGPPPWESPGVKPTAALPATWFPPVLLLNRLSWK